MNTPTFFFAATDIVVTGSNPENADVTNPRGEYFGSAGYVVAEDAVGNRVRLHIKTEQRDADALAAAGRVADALNARLASGKLPVAFDRWEETFPAYGSAAYDPQEEIEWERRVEEDAAWCQ
jgi:hypothetical protein